jgi:hypothetical protein
MSDSDQPLRLNHQLRHWEHTNNCVRPHQSLAYLTPLEFVNRWNSIGERQSVTNLLGRIQSLYRVSAIH